jgi:hypothetical protein
MFNRELTYREVNGFCADVHEMLLFKQPKTLRQEASLLVA